VGGVRLARQILEELDAARRQVDDPDLRDPGPCIQRDLHEAIAAERCVGDLDYDRTSAGIGWASA